MSAEHGWFYWARFLQQWKLKEPVAELLGSSGPLAILLAQGIYFMQPFLGWTSRGGQWQELADILEDKEKRSTFISFLRSQEQP